MSAEEEPPSVNDIESEEEPSDDSVQEESSSKEESDDNTPSEPATLLITNQSVPEVTSQLDNLHLDMGDRNRQLTPALSAVRAPTTEERSVKEWIQLHLEDYLENEWAAMKSTTRAIMATKKELFKEMQASFGYGNEQMEAELKTSWNDEAVTAQFYRGLKDQIKDEIACGDRPTTPKEMYDLAIKIDERFYERQIEKKGVYYGRANAKV
ncbi:hypothetical protein Q7P35_005195 [Cladosporium inversicolor]